MTFAFFQKAGLLWAAVFGKNESDGFAPGKWGV